MRDRSRFFPLVKLSIKLGLAIIAGISAYFLDLKQANFGEEFSQSLLSIRTDLYLENISFERDNSFAMFVSSIQLDNRKSKTLFIKMLSKDINSIYCRMIDSSKEGLKIELFHLNVRAIEKGSSRIVFSRMLSDSTCA